MRPCMRSDLVTFIYHALDDRGIWSCDINRTLAEVVASDEECSTEAVALQSIQKLACIKVRTIVVR